MPATLATPAIRSADPATILRDSRKQAVTLATQTGVGRMRTVLKTAQADLTRRLNRAQGLRGPGLESFTAAQLQVTLAQVREVLTALKPGMQSTVLTTGGEVAHQSAQDSIAYMQSAESRFTGINQPLALHEATVLDRAARGSESSLLHRLQGSPQHGPGILQRYGAGVVEDFEGVLQQRFIAQVPWGETRDRLTAASPFLQGAPAHWAERIVRTEVMGASNRASFEAMQEIDEQLGGDMLKILCATFDDRTAADSYAVHGQIRRVSEPFDTWQGPVMTPPARPNDREVVVPHRMSWPIPGNLKPRSAGEVAAKWAEEGRKGGHPPIPRYSTVDVDQIGKVAPPPRPSDANPGLREQVPGGPVSLLERPHPSAIQAPVEMPMGVVQETPEIARARVATEVRQQGSLGLPSPHMAPAGLRSLIWNHAEDKDEAIGGFARMRTDEVARVLGVSVPHALRQLQAAAREGFVNREGRQRAGEEGTFQGRVEGRGGFQLWGVPHPSVPPKATGKIVPVPKATPLTNVVQIPNRWQRLPDGSYVHSGGARLVRPEPKGAWYLKHPAPGIPRVSLGKRATFDHAERELTRLEERAVDLKAEAERQRAERKKP